MDSSEKLKLLYRKADCFMSFNKFRRGQSMFLALSEIDNPLASKLTGSEADCFYNDDLCSDFIITVLEAWNNNEGAEKC
jgi:hypothetical protein